MFPPKILPSIKELFPEHFESQTYSAPDPQGHSESSTDDSHGSQSPPPSTAPDEQLDKRNHDISAKGVSEDKATELRDADALQKNSECKERRHRCPHCGKFFNRPSSLRIHLNTHTGAKPYQCPFHGCGRQFNVSSNMRRHFRNHVQPPAIIPQHEINGPSLYNNVCSEGYVHHTHALTSWGSDTPYPPSPLSSRSYTGSPSPSISDISDQRRPAASTSIDPIPRSVSRTRYNPYPLDVCVGRSNLGRFSAPQEDDQGRIDMSNTTRPQHGYFVPLSVPVLPAYRPDSAAFTPPVHPGQGQIPFPIYTYPPPLPPPSGPPSSQNTPYSSLVPVSVWMVEKAHAG